MSDFGRPTPLVRASVEKHYGDLQGLLGLTNAQAFSLRETLVLHHFSLMRTTQDYMDDPVTMFRVHKELNEALDARLVDLLGEERFARFAAYRKGLPGRVGLRGQEGDLDG